MGSRRDVGDIVFVYEWSVLQGYGEEGGVSDVGEVVNEDGGNLKEYVGDDVLKLGEVEGEELGIGGKRGIRARYK